MDISKLRPERIDTCTKDKIIFDFFPDACDAEAQENAEEFDPKSASLHAGALCLYAALLMTRIHETDPMSLDPYFKERREELKLLAKAEPKYASYSDEQIDELVGDMLKVDIRNCFAHGNFDISYDVYTKKLNFVLNPQRKDLEASEPIVIDKNAIIKANKKFLDKKDEEYRMYAMLSDQLMIDATTTNLSSTLKGFILPTQMQRLAYYYIGKKPLMKNQVLFDNIYHYVQYVLSAAKITYEQQEYYDIFGKDSSIFASLALIRNSVAHDRMEFVDNATKLAYADKHMSKTESIAESASKLLIADSQKEMIKTMQKEGKHSEASINALKEELKKMFNFFFDGTYKFEDIAGVWIENTEQAEKE